jgi:hypothetical protein
VPKKEIQIEQVVEDAGVSPEILSQYKEADEYVLLNEDKMLHPLWIKLPKPPPIEQIEGYGLPAKKQKFKCEEMPERLEKLIEDCETIDEIWGELDDNQILYRDEIKWIETQIKKVFHGHWVFINGKPTYIDGWHYGYLNFWRFQDTSRPDYRDRNRKFFHALRYAYNTTETIETDEQGRIVYDNPELRIPKMKNVGRKVFVGIIYPKHRRDGASNQCLCAMYFESIYSLGKNSGIISASGQHAQETLFDEILVPAWKEMPFFFKPITKSNENPTKSIDFFASRKRADTAKRSKELGTRIMYSTTADSSQFDGKKIFFMLADEAGKTQAVSVYERHQQLKECVAQGAGTVIEGFIMMPSTVGEMEGSGGRNYYELCEDSKWDKRLLSGQTQSGLMLIYMPAHEGLEGYIDEYGGSVAEKPTPAQKAFIKNDIGAKEYLESKKEEYLRQGQMDKYAELCRLFPSSYIECFRTRDGEIGFNIKVINDRLDILMYEGKNLSRIGNFVWDGGVGARDTFVHWVDDDNGRFLLSKVLNPDETNRMYSRTLAGNKLVRFPLESKFTASADPYKFETARSAMNKLSLGGGAVFWDYDNIIDGGKDIDQWKTYRFVCTYLNRPKEKIIYKEDMLMMAVYFGAKMHPEIEVPDVWEHFEQRGYGGYLNYEIDLNTNMPHKTPGFNSRNRKKELFDKLRDYIEKHGHRECHEDFLKQTKEIQNIEQMTDYDILVACGGCLLGTKSHNDYFVKSQPKPMNQKRKLYPKHRYS